MPKSNISLVNLFLGLSEFQLIYEVLSPLYSHFDHCAVMFWKFNHRERYLTEHQPSFLLRGCLHLVHLGTALWCSELWEVSLTENTVLSLKILSVRSIRPIPFEDVLIILESTFNLLSDARKGRESALLTWREKRGGRLLIQTESVYRVPDTS